jgi:hypothetical protein
MAGNDLHVGDLTTHATGNVTLTSHGLLTTLAAAGDEGALLMAAKKAAALTCGSTALMLENDAEQAGSIQLQAGPAGKIVIALGPIELGPRIELSTEMLSIAVGPPGVGASIQLTPASIVLKVAENQIQLTPVALEERIAEVTRSVTPVGHVVTAGEKSHSVGLTGEEVEAPTRSADALAAANVSAAMFELAGKGMLTHKAPMVMIN